MIAIRLILGLALILTGFGLVSWPVAADQAEPGTIEIIDLTPRPSQAPPPPPEPVQPPEPENFLDRYWWLLAIGLVGAAFIIWPKPKSRPGRSLGP